MTHGKQDDPSSAKNQTITKEPVDVTIVVINYNTSHLLDRMIGCLKSALVTFSYQLIIVDNASSDLCAEELALRYDFVQWIFNEKNVGFARANNQALPLISGRYVLLLNTDAFVEEDTLVKSIGYMETVPSCGVLGVRLTDEEGHLQPSCRYFPTPWNDFLGATGLHRIFTKTRLVDNMDWPHDSVRNCDWVPGCFYLMRKDVIDAVGLFDSRYFLYYEEVDHCSSVLRAGWNVVFYPHTSVIHIGGQSAKSAGSIANAARQLSHLEIESRLLFFRKHYGLSGVCSALSLSGARIMVALIKDAIKPKQYRRIGVELAEARMIVRALVGTKFGRQPTR